MVRSFSIIERAVGNILILDFSGPINSHTQALLWQKLDEKFTKNLNPILNFIGVNDFDSSGLGELYGAVSKLRELDWEDQALRLVIDSPEFRRQFTVSGLINIMRIFKTEQEAIDDYNKTHKIPSVTEQKG